ncbi:MAG: fused MFS/spermidine synthase, partial [Bacteroidales bacterium]|nr:fused MFS/spermidine synthase [Bacteroidales bacterium]
MTDKNKLTMNKSGNKAIQQYLLFLVLFFSGVTALIYQIIWIRKFGLVFGVHVYSITTVLTAFMAGLALGSLIFGKIVDKKDNPLRVFFLLELGIGLFALFFPFLFDVLSRGYGIIAQNMTLPDYGQQLIRFSIAFLFLLIPTTLMGGTLPVIIKYFVRRLGNLGSGVSILYALNNLGAVIGGFLTGFILIRLIGVQASLLIAASLNLANALITWLIARRFKKIILQTDERYVEEEKIVRKTEDEKVVYKLPKSIVRLVLWVFAIEGFTTLAYEVIWGRILISFSFDKTVYFSTILVVSFIFGLSLGSFLIRKWIDRGKYLLSLLGYIEVAIGLISFVLLLFFSWLASFLSEQRELTDTWMQVAGKEYFIFFLLLSIPTTLMGFTYPIVSKLYTQNIKNLGNRMGTIGFLDTIGSILGSFVAGFVLIPFFGVVISFLIIVSINVLIGLLVVLSHPVMSKRLKYSITGGTLILLLVLSIQIPDRRYFTWWDQLDYKKTFFGEHYTRLLFYDEGAGSTVTVREYPFGDGYLALNVDGHNTAYSTDKDRRVNGLLGYLPYILHPDPENAIVIGYGMGVTAHSLVQPDMKQIDIAEIVPGVLKASPIFSEWNHNVLEEPKVEAHIEDGRSMIYMSRDKKYDIITSNAIHPRLSNNIYTRDFYQICREKLADDGIICQWIPPNWISEKHFKALVNGFVDAFPHSQMWYINEYSTLLVGKKEPMELNYGLIRDKMANNEKLSKEMADFGIPDPFMLLSQFIFDAADLEEYTEDAAVNTDNHPIVEFSKIINIAPSVPVLNDIRNADPDYKEKIVNADDAEYEMPVILKRIQSYRDFHKAHIESIIKS